MIKHVFKTAWDTDFTFGTWLCLGKAEWRTKNFPRKGRGIGHVTPKFSGKLSKISSKLFEPETSNLVHSFAYGMPTGRMNNIPQKGRGLNQGTPKFFGIRSNIKSSKLLELGTSNLVHGFVFVKPSGRRNNFNQKGRSTGHVTPTILAYDRTCLQNCLSYWLSQNVVSTELI